MQDYGKAPASDGQRVGSYMRTLVVNGFSIGGAFFLCGMIALLARLSGQPDAANHPIVFTGTTALAIAFYFARSRAGEFYRLVALSSMAPLAGVLGYNVWGLAVGVLMVGMYFYFMFRPRTVWQADR